MGYFIMTNPNPIYFVNAVRGPTGPPGPNDSTVIPTDTTNFNNVLGPTDTTIQKALDTVDNINNTNVGSGFGVFKQNNGPDFEFKSVQGTHVTITDGDTIDFSLPQSVAVIAEPTFSQVTASTASGPTDPAHLTRKDYVDTLDGGNVKSVNDGNQITITGTPQNPEVNLNTNVTVTNLTATDVAATSGSVTNVPLSGTDITNKTYVDTLDSGNVKSVNDGNQITITGDSQNPEVNLNTNVTVTNLTATNVSTTSGSVTNAPLSGTDITNKTYVDTLDNTNVKSVMGGNQINITGTLQNPTVNLDDNVNVTSIATTSGTISNAPTSLTDITNKSYVDSVAQGLCVKDSVRVATTANGTLSSAFAEGETIDGVILVAGNRILIKNQTNGIENGVYDVTAGTPTRSTDFNGVIPNTDASGCFFFVSEGNTQANTGWVCTNDQVNDKIGIDDLVFSQFSNAGYITAGTGLTKTGNVMNATLVATPNQTTVVNGSNNMTVGTVQDISTSSAPTFSRVTAPTSPTTGDHLTNKTYVDNQISNVTASGVATNTTNFTNNLSNADTDVQKALDTLNTIDHTKLTNIGTNTHAQIDSHISSTSNPHSVTKTQVGLGNVENLQVNLIAIIDPTSSNDSGEGYAVGSRWINTTSDNEFVCVDATASSAVWVKTTEINTASNVGSETGEVFKQKAGVDLEFKTIGATSNKIAITNNTNDVGIDVNEGNIVHQNLSGAGTNTHAQIDSHIASTSNPHSVTKTQIGLGNVENLQVNLTAIIDPTSSNDSGEGYAVGSRWINTTSDNEFVCVDATASSAVWVKTTEINTASNVGGETGEVFKQKAGVDLEFKTIGATSNKIAIANNTNDVGIDVNEGNIVHQNLSGAGTNTHAQIDSHIVSTSNPHSVTKTQVGLGNVENLQVNLTAIADPTSSNDSGEGYTVGSRWINTTSDNEFVCVDATASSAVWVKTTEINTVSNIGTAGVGVFKQKTGDDFEFKKINAASNKLSVTDDTGNNEVDIGINESNINILDFSGAPSSAVVGISDAQTLSNKTLGSNLDANSSYKIVQLVDPTSAQDAATKAYVDAVATGLNVKGSVRAATTSAGTLASDFDNGKTIDGVTLATNDRILIKNQANGIENGIYIVQASGAPNRAGDYAAGINASGTFCFVQEGTANADSGWVCITDGNDTVGTHAIEFTKFSGAGQVVAGNGIVKSGTMQNTLNADINNTNGGLDFNSGQIEVQLQANGGLVFNGNNIEVDINASGVDVLSVEKGGTSLTSYINGDLIVANGMASLTQLPSAPTGQVLRSGGTGGAPSYGKVDLTTDVTDTLPVANGGTNINSYDVGDLIVADGTTSLTQLPSAPTGQVLRSGGTGGAPSYGKVDLTTDVTDTLPVANGGTNLTSYTIGDLIIADGTTSLTKLPSAPTGQVLRSGGTGGEPSYGSVDLTSDISGTLPIANGGTETSSAPSNGTLLIGKTDNTYAVSNLAATTNQTTITNGDGSITIGTVQDINTTSSPTFSGISLTSGTIMNAPGSGTSIVNRNYADTKVGSVSAGSTKISIGGTTTNPTVDAVENQININNLLNAPSGNTNETLRFNGANMEANSKLTNDGSSVVKVNDVRFEVGSGPVLFRGGTASAPASGVGSRTMWIPNKYAFRAGTVSSDQWNDANIGSGSVAFGTNNVAFGSNSVVGGGDGNTASGLRACIVGGINNTASGSDSVVGGGNNNTATAAYATVSGGQNNDATASNTFVGGGLNVNATNTYAVACGGGNITAAGNSSFIGGGGSNTTGATAKYSGVVGGAFNDANGEESFVGCGNTNTTNGTRSVICGGFNNTSSGIDSFIGGGNNNIASGEYAFIGGGASNNATYLRSTICGGAGNTSSGFHSFVGGGANNLASGDQSVIGGGQSNEATSTKATICGGQSNTVSGDYAFVGAGQNNHAEGPQSAILVGTNGFISNDSSSSVILGGFDNTITSSSHATIAGGNSTVNAGSHYAFIGGASNSTSGRAATAFGEGNAANGDRSSVLGGQTNNATNGFAFIGNGASNTASGGAAFIGNGLSNTASNTRSTICGGRENNVSGTDSFIGCGYQNSMSGNYGSVCGGWQNNASGLYGAICGGTQNAAANTRAFIGNGLRNNVTGGFGSSVVNGEDNVASGDISFIGGGQNNTASGTAAVICGGQGNTATGTNTFIGGGQFNQALNGGSMILAGGSNISSGINSVICGGTDHNASGQNSFIGGGTNITISGLNSASFGTLVNCIHEDAFVFGDGGTQTQSVGNNSFTVGARDGVKFFTNNGIRNSVTSTSGPYLIAGDTTWRTTSNKDKKENFQDIDGNEVLNKISNMSAQSWNYKGDDPKKQRHYGPYSQEIFEAFGNDGIGTIGDDISICLSDMDGILWTAVKALTLKVKTLEEEVNTLKNN
jgi:Chaperone of endosialidase